MAVNIPHHTPTKDWILDEQKKEKYKEYKFLEKLEIGTKLNYRDNAIYEETSKYWPNNDEDPCFIFKKKVGKGFSWACPTNTPSTLFVSEFIFFVLNSKLWSVENHSGFPSFFKITVFTLFLCSKSNKLFPKLILHEITKKLGLIWNNQNWFKK